MERDLLLGSLELPDFDGAFWFDKLDEIGFADGHSLASATLPVAALDPAVGEAAAPPPATQREDSLDLHEEPEPSESPPPQKRRRGRGRKKSNLSLEERREKNREIQARYRAKQRRERTELESICSQVSQEIEHAHKEHAIAQHKREILEKVLIMRDAAVDLLSKGSNGGGASKPSTSKDTQESDENPRIKTIKNPNCVINGMKSSENTNSGVTTTTNESIEDGSGSSGSGVPRPVVRHVYKTLSTDLGAPVHSIADAYDAAKRLDETDNEEIAAKNPHYQELVSSVRGMTGHQLVEGWRNFALKLRNIINAHEENFTEGGTRPAHSVVWDMNSLPKVMEEIEPLFEEQVTVLSTALRHNLPAVQALFNTAGEVHDPMTYWSKVAEKMQITPKQRESFISLWNAYLSRISSLKEQRNGMVQSLIQAAGLSPSDCQNVANDGGHGITVAPVSSADVVNKPLPVDSLNLMMTRYCNLFDATGNVAATPDNELTALLDLMREAGNVWSLFQKAKLTALAYPAFPDIVRFLKAVAAGEEKAGGGAALLEQGNL